jgi:hypothetical protein
MRAKSQLSIFFGVGVELVKFEVSSLRLPEAKLGDELVKPVWEGASPLA